MAITPTEIRTWTIYKLVNPENQAYIGRTSLLKERLQNYKNLGGKCNKQKLLYESLVKYGLDGHKLIILETFDSIESRAGGKEIFWIRSNMANRNKWPEMGGLNLSDGGQGGLGMKIVGRPSAFKGKTHTSETIAFLSQYSKDHPTMSMLGKKHTEEAKKAMSKKKKGMVSVFKGKHHTLENRIASSKARIGKPSKLKGRKLSPEMKVKMASVRNTVKRPVLIEKDGIIQEFRSIISAYTFLGISKGFFHNVINGADNCQYNGYTLKFKI